MIGILNPSSTDKNPESRTWKPESKIQDSLSCGDVVTSLISMKYSVARHGSTEPDLNSTSSVQLSLRRVTGSGLGLSGQRWSSVTRTPSKWFSQAMRRKKDLCMILSDHFLVSVSLHSFDWYSYKSSIMPFPTLPQQHRTQKIMCIFTYCKTLLTSPYKRLPNISPPPP